MTSAYASTDRLERLLAKIRACNVCTVHLPFGPRPVLQVHPAARLCIVGQAPGRKVHVSGIPWDDASGDRLRSWLGLSGDVFYDSHEVAIVPMGLCYPGKAASGDKPPRPECAPRWHAALSAELVNIRLTILAGHYAQRFYLGAQAKPTLTETVRAWRHYIAVGFIPIPHPSPRNQAWLVRNRWFETELVPELGRLVASLGLGKATSRARRDRPV